MLIVFLLLIVNSLHKHLGKGKILKVAGLLLSCNSKIINNKIMLLIIIVLFLVLIENNNQFYRKDKEALLPILKNLGKKFQR